MVLLVLLSTVSILISGLFDVLRDSQVLWCKVYRVMAWTLVGGAWDSEEQKQYGAVRSTYTMRVIMSRLVSFLMLGVLIN